jgi:C4-dicarboxylate transporter
MLKDSGFIICACSVIGFCVMVISHMIIQKVKDKRQEKKKREAKK